MHEHEELKTRHFFRPQKGTCKRHLSLYVNAFRFNQQALITSNPVKQTHQKIAEIFVIKQLYFSAMRKI
ncbi:hypothetical protein D4Z78_18040 [Okeania hirsuta]|nr:hypothetical protein D4Z78_18040 [Okeania hirsuta]